MAWCLHSPYRDWYLSDCPVISYRESKPSPLVCSQLHFLATRKMSSWLKCRYCWGSFKIDVWNLYGKLLHVWGCVQKFPVWTPGARTANDTALCHLVQLYRYFVSQSSAFCRRNPLCCFLTSVCCCCLFRYRLSPETFGYTLVYALRVWAILKQTRYNPSEPWNKLRQRLLNFVLIPHNEYFS